MHGLLACVRTGVFLSFLILGTPWAGGLFPVLFHFYVPSHGRIAHQKLKVTGGRTCAAKRGSYHIIIISYHTVPNHPLLAVLRIVLLLHPAMHTLILFEVATSACHHVMSEKTNCAERVSNVLNMCIICHQAPPRRRRRTSDREWHRTNEGSSFFIFFFPKETNNE